MSELALRLPSGVLMLCAALLALRCATLVGRWRVGGPANVDLLSGLARLPRRYLRDVHEVVAREPRSARMHASLAGGLLGALVLVGVPELVGLGSPWTAVPGLLCLSAAAFGLVLQAQRRLPTRPPRFSGGRFRWLSPALAAALLFLAWVACQQITGRPGPGSLTFMTTALGLAGLGWLALTVAEGPMRHAAAGVAYLSSHPRPQRFDGGLSADLKPLDLSGPSLGAGRPRDFGWNRLASFDACIQCGRCEAACPAFAAGQPLNPKALINDLASALAPAGMARRYAGSPHPGRPPAAVGAGPMASLVVDEPEKAGIAPETLWSCTTCRACVQECPMLIEHVDAVIDLRRFQTLEKGAVVGKSGEALMNLRLTDTASGRSLASRLDWAADLGIPVLSAVGRADMLLWLGESAFDLRNQRSLRAFVQLLKQAGMDFAVLGEEERDTGDLARRLGDEATFQRLAEANIETLKRYHFDQIVTLDPHVLHTLRNEYPAFGGRWRVRHHSDVLRELLTGDRLRVVRPVALDATFHDPCYLGRYNREFEASRAVLAASGVTLREMTRSGTRASCCGGGGGAPLADVPGKRRIPDIRMDHARETGASVVAVGCPYCAQMLEGVTGKRPDVRDVAEILLDAVEGVS